MIEWNETDKKIFSEYSKHIIHMRRQFILGNFGLVLGAGISLSLDVPLWSELNNRIAADPEVQGDDLRDSDISDPMLTKRLFEHYKNAKHLDKHIGTKEERKRNLEKIKKWIEIMHRHLYSGVDDPDLDIKKSHEYLGNYLNIIRNTNITINYNFDDFVEKMLLQNRASEEQELTKGYKTVTDITLPYTTSKRIIYHPNGFLPYKLSEKSVNLVFAEDEFADQLIGVTSGHYSALIHHYCSNTCLFIGASLADATLKHLLRQVSRLNPGHCHYYVQYYSSEEFSNKQKEAISKANFETYNLITLFLNDEEIASLGKIIECGIRPEGFSHDGIYDLEPATGKPSVYIYYIIGAVGVGKSSTISHFRDMVTYDEWTEPRELDLGKEPESIKDKKRIEKLDTWIASQFFYKNNRLSHETPGVIVVDRCPLDPISFTEYDLWSQKADFLKKTLAIDIVPGHIIVLMDDPAVLELRSIPTYKEWSEERLTRLQEDIGKIYCMENVTVIETKYMNHLEVIKEVARVIHMEKYKTAKINERLIAIKEKGDSINE